MEGDYSRPAFVQHWSKQLGAKSYTIERLVGGINNMVFSCSKGADKWVIKGYMPIKHGERDGMYAEVQFLRYANKVAPGYTPELIHIDWDQRCVVLEYIEGESFKKGVTPSYEAVDAATVFIQMLNSQPEIAQEYISIDAAEGFLSLEQHIDNIELRSRSMSWEHIDSQNKDLARYLIEHIKGRLQCIKADIDERIKSGVISNAIGDDERCISPSDFGFHNAINTPNGIRFIDFEFAGWDDPAKATLDFVLQPCIPVEGFGLPLLSAWRPELQNSISTRCQQLCPILKLKWLCIILAVLNKERLNQIKNILPPGKRESFIENRLNEATNYIKLHKA